MSRKKKEEDERRGGLLDDVGVVEFLEEGNLTDGGARDTFVLRLETDALESDNFVSLLVLCLVDDTISALAELFDVTVAIHCCVFSFAFFLTTD